MNRSTRLSVSLLLFALAGFSPERGWSQEEDLIAGISETGATRIHLALPDFQASPRGSLLSLQAARTIHQILRSDLDYSGYFDFVNPDYYELVSGYNERDPKFQDWTAIGANSLILGKTEEFAKKLLFEGRLYDIPSKLAMMGKRYRGGVGSLRSIAHKFADEVVLQYTGERGVATSRIAYVHQQGPNKNIFIMDYDGEHQMQLTRDQTLNLTPAWSPDGSRIAFLSYRRGFPELVILSQDGPRVRAFPQSGELNASPDWSQDGKFLLFTSSRDGNAEIYSLRIEDGRISRLTHHSGIDTSPAWSPNSRQILFTSDRSGSPQIYIMDAEGTHPRRLTFQGSYNDQGSWAPSLGGSILYTSRVEGRFQIFRIDLKDRNPVPLTSGRGNKESPSWSPDGRHIAFCSNITGRYEIYTMNSEGERLNRLTRGGGNTHPAWSR